MVKWQNLLLVSYCSEDSKQGLCPSAMGLSSLVLNHGIKVLRQSFFLLLYPHEIPFIIFTSHTWASLNIFLTVQMLSWCVFPSSREFGMTSHESCRCKLTFFTSWLMTSQPYNYWSGQFGVGTTLFSLEHHLPGEFCIVW